jgi:hypothetical protein
MREGVQYRFENHHRIEKVILARRGTLFKREEDMAVVYLSQGGAK